MRAAALLLCEEKLPELGRVAEERDALHARPVRAREVHEGKVHARGRRSRSVTGGVAHVNTLAGLPAGALAVKQQRVGERLAAQGRVVSDDDGGEASGEVVLGEEPVHLGAVARGDDTEPEPRPREVVKELLDVIEPIGGGGKLGVVLDPSWHEGAIVRNAESLEPGLVRDAKGTAALLD